MTFARAFARDPAFAATALGAELRAAGLPVTPERSATFARAVGLSGKEAARGLYWPARLAFVADPAHLDVFEAVFAAVVEGVDPALAVPRGDPTAPGRSGERPGAPRALPAAGAQRGSAGDTPGKVGARPGDEAGEWRVGAQASDVERLAQARLEELTAAEVALLADLVRRMRVATPPRRARRAQRSHRGDHLDVRATLRRAHRTGGDPVERLHRRRSLEPRPLVVLLDVSGSMAAYARVFLLLLEGAARASRAEAFVFATRLTRVTKALREGRAQTAVERASGAAPDWAGGTRIGEALRAFTDRWGRRGMARGAVLVIVSDGWERGSPELVGREMPRLRRLAHRIVWVNPRAGAPGFRPEAGGMAAALPFVDELVSGHSVAALDDVLTAIANPKEQHR